MLSLAKLSPCLWRQVKEERLLHWGQPRAKCQVGFLGTGKGVRSHTEKYKYSWTCVKAIDQKRCCVSRSHRSASCLETDDVVGKQDDRQQTEMFGVQWWFVIRRSTFHPLISRRRSSWLTCVTSVSRCSGFLIHRDQVPWPSVSLWQTPHVRCNLHWFSFIYRSFPGLCSISSLLSQLPLVASDGLQKGFSKSPRLNDCL